nr:hypothetical protein [Tanacetum cinerariifolium]
EFHANEVRLMHDRNSDLLALVATHQMTQRQISFAMGTTRTYTQGTSGSNSGKQRTVICYNCKDMSKQCTKPKRKRDDSCLDTIAEVHNPDNVDNNMINQSVQVMPSSEQPNVVNHSETEITSDSNIIPYSQFSMLVY